MYDIVYVNYICIRAGRWFGRPIPRSQHIKFVQFYAKSEKSIQQNSVDIILVMFGVSLDTARYAGGNAMINITLR